MALQTVDDQQQSPPQELSPGTRNRDSELIAVHKKAERVKEDEYRTQLQQIAKLQRQMEAQEKRLDQVRLSAGMPDAHNKELVEQRVADYNKDPRSIAPEDALDTIVRLENQLKLQRRRNQLVVKEIDRDRRAAKDRRNTLGSVTVERDRVLYLTGWDGKTMRSPEEQTAMKERIDEMATLAQRLREEHRAANLLVHKKEHVVQFLLAELQKRKDQREALDAKYNDIRVLDRENRQVAEQIKKTKEACNKTDGQIALVGDNYDTTAVKLLQEDVAYLTSAMKRKKDKKAEQEKVCKAQQERTRQLTTRFETLGGALRDLGLDRRVQQALTTVPPAVESSAEPDDMERIFPKEEQIPTCVYELLIRDMANIRSAVARKDVMVVEKQCVKAMLEEKLEEYANELRFAREQEAHLKDDKFIEMRQLSETLTQQHEQFRKEIDEMLSRNLKLKNDVLRAAKQQQQE